MSELFTQTNKQKELFRTEEDIVANIQTQFGMPHTGKDLLLDAKMGPNKDQSSRLDSEPDALSDTGMSDDVGAGDTSGILHDSAGGNKNTITGTNTPRSSRTSAYYDLLRSQHKNGHYKAPAPTRLPETVRFWLKSWASPRTSSPMSRRAARAKVCCSMAASFCPSRIASPRTPSSIAS